MRRLGLRLVSVSHARDRTPSCREHMNCRQKEATSRTTSYRARDAVPRSGYHLPSVPERPTVAVPIACQEFGTPATGEDCRERSARGDPALTARLLPPPVLGRNCSDDEPRVVDFLTVSGGSTLHTVLRSATSELDGNEQPLAVCLARPLGVGPMSLRDG
jgi:hypothetical protein